MLDNNFIPRYRWSISRATSKEVEGEETEREKKRTKKENEEEKEEEEEEEEVVEKSGKKRQRRPSIKEEERKQGERYRVQQKANHVHRGRLPSWATELNFGQHLPRQSHE